MSIFGVRTLDKLGSVIKLSETSVSVGQSKLMGAHKNLLLAGLTTSPLSQASWCKANM